MIQFDTKQTVHAPGKGCGAAEHAATGTVTSSYTHQELLTHYELRLLCIANLCDTTVIGEYLC